MLTALSWLVFAVVAVLACAAVGVTLAQYRDVALRNVAALRDSAATRDFQVSLAGGGRPALAGHPNIRRNPQRARIVRAGLRPVTQPRRVAA